MANTAQRWLEAQGPKATFTTEENREIQKLVGNPGFGLLLQMLAAERQGFYVQLSHINLADAAGTRLASVLQGRIQGIERIREAVLELYPDEVPASEGAKQ